MSRTVTSRQVKAMQNSRQRARQRRRADAIKRVNAYMRWLKNGSRTREIPPLPSDADFRIARGAR